MPVLHRTRSRLRRSRTAVSRCPARARRPRLRPPNGPSRPNVFSRTLLLRRSVLRQPTIPRLQAPVWRDPANGRRRRQRPRQIDAGEREPRLGLRVLRTLDLRLLRAVAMLGRAAPLLSGRTRLRCLLLRPLVLLTVLPMSPLLLCESGRPPSRWMWLFLSITPRLYSRPGERVAGRSPLVLNTSQVVRGTKKLPGANEPARCQGSSLDGAIPARNGVAHRRARPPAQQPVSGLAHTTTLPRPGSNGQRMTIGPGLIGCRATRRVATRGAVVVGVAEDPNTARFSLTLLGASLGLRVGQASQRDRAHWCGLSAVPGMHRFRGQGVARREVVS